MPVLQRHVLGERVAEALHGAALDLPLHPHRVDGPAHVVACGVAQHGDLPGLGVDLYVGGVRAVGVVGERVALSGPRVESARLRPPGRQVCRADRPLVAGGGELGKGKAHRRRARRGGAHQPVGELQLILGHAEQVGRHRRHPVAQFPGRVQDRVPRHVQLPGGERAAGRRVERGVADVDADVVEPRAEHLGGDLAQAGRLPGAEVGDAAADQQRAVRLQAQPGRRPVAEPDRPAVGVPVAAEAAADQLPRPGRPGRLAEHRERAMHGLADLYAGVQPLPGRQQVALGQEVALPHLDAGQAEALGQAVHLALVAVHHLHRAEPAEGARRGVVGEHRGRGDAGVGRLVGPAGAGGAREQHPRRQVGVGAGVAEDLDLLRGDRAVQARPGPVPHDERVPLGARGQRFLPVPDHPHRPPGPPDQQREERLDRHVLLAAEAAAHVGRDHPDLALRQPQDLRDRRRVLDDLGGHPQREHAVLQPAHPGLRLEVGVLDVLGAVLPLHHHVGGGHRRGRVATPDLPADQRVADLVDARSAVGAGRFDVEDAGQLLVVDAHQFGRLVGELLGGGGHHRHRLSEVPDPVLGQHRHRHLELGQAAARPLHDLVVRHVGRGEHGGHAGQRAGRGDVKTGDPGARQRAADHPAVQHAGQLPVRRVVQRPLDLVHEVVVGRRGAHYPVARPRLGQ